VAGSLFSDGHASHHFRQDGRTLIRDEESMECRTMAAVLDEARASSRDIASEARWSSDTPLPCIEIEDEDGNEVQPRVSLTGFTESTVRLFEEWGTHLAQAT